MLKNQGNNLSTEIHTEVQKEIPYSQQNVINVDPTPGIICAIAIFIIICFVIGRVDFWVNRFFNQKKEMDELELNLKYEKEKR